jgi:hypothetical protein
VIVTGAFLAEHAEIVDDKLNVAGGVLDSVNIPKPVEDGNGNIAIGLVALVVLLRADRVDEEVGHQIRIELVEQDGARQLAAQIDMDDAFGGENRFLVWHVPFNIHTTGRVNVVITADGNEPFELAVHASVREET